MNKSLGPHAKKKKKNSTNRNIRPPRPPPTPCEHTAHTQMHTQARPARLFFPLQSHIRKEPDKGSGGSGGGGGGWSSKRYDREIHAYVYACEDESGLEPPPPPTIHSLSSPSSPTALTCISFTLIVRTVHARYVFQFYSWYDGLVRRRFPTLPLSFFFFSHTFPFSDR